MDLQTIGKLMLVLALGIALLGVLLCVGGRLGLGSLPGDIRIQGKGYSCFIPIASSILLSIILSILLTLFGRMFGGGGR